MIGPVLLDNSAWARLGSPQLAVERADEIAEAVLESRVATCLPFLLEAGYSARNAGDYETIVDELRGLPYFHVDGEVERRAVDAQRQLARVGHHRLPPVDVLVASIADRHDVGVLHYDRDYDLIAAKTDLNFQSVWLAPAGALA